MANIVTLVRDTVDTITDWRLLHDRTGYWPMWSILSKISVIPFFAVFLWIATRFAWGRRIPWYGYVVLLLIIGIWAVLDEKVQRIERKSLLHRKRNNRFQH